MDELRKTGLLQQVIVLFSVAVILIGICTYISLYLISDRRSDESTEYKATQIAIEVKESVEEYPAYKWLISYWHDHADELDIEYDVDFGAGTLTEQKTRTLMSHQPSLQIKYATEEELAKLPPEDQKLYAEITYSWLITRVNQIKLSYDVNYLYCVLTDNAFSQQFFLFSAADEDSTRGTNYEEVYTLGVTVDVSEEQSQAMRDAANYDRHLVDAGDYVDFYALLTWVDDYNVLIGMTVDMARLDADAAAETRNGTAFITLLLILLSLTCLAMTSAYVIRPIKHVKELIRTYKQTKDSSTIANDPYLEKNRNEIGELATDVKDLALEMDEHVLRMEAITAERERIGAELDMARQIQASMMPNVFPPFPDRSEFDIFALMEPAKEVGGDFYDFYMIDEDHIALIIADVSGKGIPASLFMMATKIILQSCAMLRSSPAEILYKTNEAVCSNNKEEMFITVWVGILEISTGKLTAANAGHEYPVMRRAGGDFKMFRDRHGFVIGGMTGADYTEYELQLQPGDKVFVFTDGVTEATNAYNELLGNERLLAALNQDTYAPPEEIIGNVHKAIDDFVKDAEQFDDITMLCLEYKGL